jgi:septal ring factor EnvC (AmiA/AmiB activator)
MSLEFSHRLQRILLLTAAIALYGLCVHTPLQAAIKGESAKDVSISIGRLQEGIKRHTNKIAESAGQEKSVLEQLEIIDGKLHLQQEKIAELQKKLAGQVKQLAVKDEELKKAEIARDEVLKHLQKRLRSFYLMGKTGILNVTFSHKTLPDLMLFTDAYKQLITYDQAVIDKYRESVNALQRARHAQELEKTLLQDFIRQAEEQKQALQELRKEQEALMSRIKTQTSLYKLALQEMHKAESDLNHTLATIKHNEEIKKRGFQLSKKKLPAPVKGTLVLMFGETTHNGLTKGEKSKGITIATRSGAPVHAIYKGKVIFAGYKRGYGNTVIIDHGFKYATVTSHLDTIVVKKGERVKKGTLIGSTGDMATLFTKGLYFEIRLGSTPQDPLLWLKPGTYTAR